MKLTATILPNGKVLVELNTDTHTIYIVYELDMIAAIKQAHADWLNQYSQLKTNKHNAN